MKKLSENEAYESAAQQLQMYKSQLDRMEEMNASYRSICHNIKHHMCLLADYIENNENQRALEYLEKLNYRMKECNRYIYTGNCGIDSILNRKIQEIKEAGGKVTADIKIQEGLLVDDLDMNVILGNLLSNACEAIGECEEKEIEILIRYDRGVLLFRVTNSYKGMVLESGGLPLTTKKNKKEHGIGLTGVKKVAEKYRGELHITYDENKFCAFVMLYINGNIV